MHRILLIGSLALFLVPPLALGQDLDQTPEPPAALPPDFERAGAAVASGQILPLAEILERAQARYPGRVIQIELDDDDGRMVYEVELVTTDGRLIELELDAASGDILDVEEGDDD